MFDSPILWFIWGYLSMSERVFVIVLLMFATDSICTTAYRLLEYATGRVTNLHGNITWSIGQVSDLFRFTWRMGTLALNCRAAPAAPAAAAAPALVFPQHNWQAPARAGARGRSPHARAA